MKNSFKCLLVTLFLNACSSDLDNSFEANTLIVPDFVSSNHLIECNLKDNINLLSLESFMSNLVKNKFYKDNNFSLRVYLPKTDFVNKFILDIQNNSNEDFFSSFINDLSIKGFDEIASCNFNTPKLDGFVLFDNRKIENQPLITIEILSCSYNDGYNFGTFKLALDRFSNEMSLKKIPYGAVYLQDNNSLDKFIWINNFYSDDYSNEITNLWINTNEAKEIRDEFLENAQCIKSDIYNSYAIN
tara:strand:- start:1059 stop:1790 length:732 start_codon:yes stop_codon:yes gene_type:complete